MRKYLYIPTTTRNLNNILISRAVSPANFYPDKGFGVQRFHLTSLNNNGDVTYCFSEPIEFDIAKTDYEEDPILIIIPVDYIKPCTSDSIKVDDTLVHRVYESIKLIDLLDCFILFFSDDAKKRCEIDAEKAIEIKGLQYIKEIFRVKDEKKGYLAITNKSYQVKKPVEGNEVLRETSLRKERLEDKVKGANICYRLSLVKNHKHVSWFSPELPKAQRNIKKLLQVSKFLEIIDEDNIQISEDFNDVALGNRNDNEKIMFNIIIKTISEIDEVYDNDIFMENRIVLLQKIGRNIIEFMVNRNIASERDYIISFGQNLTEYSEFDIESTNSNVLKSLILVFIAGRNLDKLESNLLHQNANIHGLSFFIWGIFFGYCNIPKTVYDPVFCEVKAESKKETLLLHDTNKAAPRTKKPLSQSDTLPLGNPNNELQTYITKNSTNLKDVVDYIAEKGDVAVAQLKSKYTKLFSKMKNQDITNKLMEFDNTVHGYSKDRKSMIRKQ
ncbi:MAG: hypothetical protein P8H22_09820 [Glaciecola sp.]|nr:hypothetical protein [Glaciecola sp.]